MANGILGKLSPSANTWTLLYTVPSTTTASVSVNCVNRGGVNSAIDIAASTSSTSGGIAVTEYIEFSGLLNNLGSVIERTGLVLNDSNSKYLWVRASSANITFTVYGYEE
jgi:hypothetical protein